MRIPGKLIADAAIEARHMTSSAKEAVLNSKYYELPIQVDNIAAGSGNSVDVTDKVFSAAVTKKTNGGQAQLGIVTTTPFNKVDIVDKATEGHIFDSSKRQVYGRITHTNVALTGVITFTNLSNAVVGDANAIFTTEAPAGTYIKLDSDGTVGKVASVQDNQHLTLASPYGGASGAGAASKVTLALSFFVGNDIAHVMGGQNIVALYGESIDLQNVPFQAFMSGVAYAESLPAEHTHDERYYTESEIDTLLAGKSDTSHLHDDRYYTESEMDTLLSGKSDTGHLHDARYYTESEVDTLLAGKSDSSHLHDDRYFTETELQAATGTTGASRIGVLPTNIIGTSSTTVQSVLEDIARKRRNEKLSVTAQDTLSTLAYTPRESEGVVLIVGGVPQDYGVSYDYTVSAKTVTWNYANALFHLEVGDNVRAIYDSMD